MRTLLTTAIGKSVRAIAKLRGGGSALPGLVVERLDRGYLARVLGTLPQGVVLVSGTNGKTTTTKMIVEILEAQGLRVFTNRTGSNFARGVVAAAVAESTWSGSLQADIAVLELDEAHAMYFIDRVRPRVTLLLNVLRDQLDRFGEIDTTAKLLNRIAEATTEAVIVNGDDALVRAIGAQAQSRGDVHVRLFDLDESLRTYFPSDAELHGAVQRSGAADTTDGLTGDVTLASFADHRATFRMDGRVFETPLLVEGHYNYFNAAAALATVRASLGDGDRAVDNEALISALAAVRPAFGRGERVMVQGETLDLVLVKNPAGFRLALSSFEPGNAQTMIAINDNYADGRDMSWLWDVDFTSLRAVGVEQVSGIRAWDMALRLELDEVPVRNVNEQLGAALDAFISLPTQGETKRVFCTYTAMLELRRHLANIADLEDVWS